MTRKTLDPNLASILDSIRATVGGEALAQPEPGPAVKQAEPDPDDAKPVAPLPTGSRTVEEFLAELIRPQLNAWLKANLPELIQKMAAEEIARLTDRE
ncbi:MAG: DUF2497 domain-containing protein [Sandaracinobacter sp.]